jgi:effector-binding domain-containing protein
MIEILTCMGWMAGLALAQAGGPTAEALLERLETKVGGAEQRARPKSLVVRGAIRMTEIPPGKFEQVYLGTDKVKWTFEFGEWGASTWGTDGRVSWNTDPGTGITIKEGDEQAPVLRLFGISRGAPWKSLYEKAELKGVKDLGGRPHHELRMTPRAGKPDAWFVDQETGLLSRVDLALPDPLGGDNIAMEWHFLDWKNAAGALRPHKFRQVVTGMTIEYTVEGIEADAEKRTKRGPDRGGECAIETLEPQPVASVRLTTKPGEVSKTLAGVLTEVMKYLGKQGVMPAGPPFSRYHRVGPDELDLEAGFPVSKAVAGEGRIKASELPGGRTAVTWHFGSYDKLMESHSLLEAWIKKQPLKPRGGAWEVYWTDPGLEPNPQKWKTQVLWPVE